MTVHPAWRDAHPENKHAEGRMSVTDPLVSVIIPAYNSSAYLADAIVSATRQTHTNIEIIIVDDGSTDDTGTVADQFAAGDARITVIHQPNGGLSAARNTGMGVAKGEFICFLDADDALLPDKTRQQVAFFQASPDCDLVYSDHFISRVSLEPMDLTVTGPPPLPFTELLVLRNWFPPNVPLLRTSLARRVGTFDESLQAAEDWDYWTRCAAAGQFGYSPGPVAIYRFHGAQMSRQFERMRRAEWQVIDKHYGGCARRSRLARAARHLARAKHSKRTPLEMVRESARFLQQTRSWTEVALLLRVVP